MQLLNANNVGFRLYLIDDDELNVMATIFEFAREVIKLELTDTELSLMCALALIDPSKYTRRVLLVSLIQVSTHTGCSCSH